MATRRSRTTWRASSGGSRRTMPRGRSARPAPRRWPSSSRRAARPCRTTRRTYEESERSERGDGGRWACPEGRAKRGPSVKTSVLVTGATGFLGEHLCRALVEQGHIVRGLARTRSAVLESIGVEHVRGDVLSGDELDRALDGVSAVFHLAGA